MGRSPCCSREGLNRGAWTAMEDKILTDYIKIHGEGKWRSIPKRAGLQRCGKSCRLRWLNYLRPDIKRGNITSDEEELIIRLHNLLGNRWSLIAGRLPGRTDNEIKNYWNTNIGKKHRNSNPNSSNPSGGSAQLENLKNNQTSEDPLKPKQTPCVVRTKARRCTKVVISPEVPLQFDDQTGHTMKNVFDDNKLMMGSEPLESPFGLNEDDPPEFMVDMELDDKFLSDILNMDFSRTSCVEDSNSSTCEMTQLLLSPNSDQTHLASDESVNGSDFQSMAALVDCDFDWI